MSKKEDKGMFDSLKEFYSSSKNFLLNCQKPDRKGTLYTINKNK